jgi:hypothetical protein
MIGDLVKRSLLPFLSLRKPENPALEIKRGALPAQGFLTANFDQPVHALHSWRVKPFRAISVTESRTLRPMISVHIATQNGTAALPVQRCSLRTNASPHHQYVIEPRDDVRDRAILTLVAQWRAAICEEKF